MPSVTVGEHFEQSLGKSSSLPLSLPLLLFFFFFFFLPWRWKDSSEVAKDCKRQRGTANEFLLLSLLPSPLLPSSFFFPFFLSSGKEGIETTSPLTPISGPFPLTSPSFFFFLFLPVSPFPSFLGRSPEKDGDLQLPFPFPSFFLFFSPFSFFC